MDIKEKAKTYAEGKALAAISSAIEVAYAEGYKDGYCDGVSKKDEISPKEIFEVVDYVDLGLPSGKKWSSIYVMDKAREDFHYKEFTYDEASELNIPTIEDFQELLANCRLAGNTDSSGLPHGNCEIIGKKGNYIYLKEANYKSGSNYVNHSSFIFWIKDDNSDGNLRKCADGDYTNRIGKMFIGLKLPIMLVR